jgi:hypothetical protein
MISSLAFPLLSLLLHVHPAQASGQVLRFLPADAVDVLRAEPQTAGSGRHEPMVNGTPTSDYPAVGALLVIDDSGFGGAICSATLIDPGWAVTAAHCVELVNNDYSSFDAYFAVGPDVYAADGIVDHALVSAATRHPDFNASTLVNDVGVLELAGTIEAADPMPVNVDTIDNSWLGKDLRYVGYGITADGAKDGGVRRTADIPVETYDHMFIYSYDQTGTFNVCSGDSGGAGLEILGDGMFELAAVNSFVYSPDKDETPCVGGATGGTRVDRFIDWLSTYADMHTADGSPARSGSGDTDSGGGHYGFRHDGNTGCTSLPRAQGAPLGLLVGLCALLQRRGKRPAR